VIRIRLIVLAALVLGPAFIARPAVQSQDAPRIDYRVLATSRTSTMERELNDAADLGFRFTSVMGGETAIGGKEVVVVLSRTADARPRYRYKLLATNRTSTMQREMQEAADGGFEYVGQTVFESAFGGKEVVCILERDRNLTTPVPFRYQLLATTRTSTLQKELQVVGDQGYELVGMTVGKTAMGGTELVAITRRPQR
jgi:hypothetical protein